MWRLGGECDVIVAVLKITFSFRFALPIPFAARCDTFVDERETGKDNDVTGDVDDVTLVVFVVDADGERWAPGTELKKNIFDYFHYPPTSKANNKLANLTEKNPTYMKVFFWGF